jgi:hypothetical protein
VQATELHYITSTPGTTDHDGAVATELDGRSVGISGCDEATGEAAKSSGRIRPCLRRRLNAAIVHVDFRHVAIHSRYSCSPRAADSALTR